MAVKFANTSNTPLELNREYPQPDEDEVFAKMVKITIDQMKTVGGCPHRAQHSKPTGCVTATFRVVDDIPIEQRQGVFREPGRSFNCLIRFSNSQGTIKQDGVGTARGMAIKLQDVDGQWTMDGTENRTQDFVMFDHHVFPFPTPQHYLDTMRRKSVPLIGDLVAGTHLALFERDELQILKALRGKRVASPLEIKYWSGSPYWLGSADGQDGHAVKYTAVPRESPTEPPKHPDDMPEDYLRQALTNHLAKREAVFDFHVQLQTDAEAMPIEDVSKAWDEGVSKPILVASIHIAEQNVSADSEIERRCQTLSFNPWHALAEHRPLGGMNRLRRAVYSAGFSQRVKQSI